MTNPSSGGGALPFCYTELVFSLYWAIGLNSKTALGRKFFGAAPPNFQRL